MAQPDRQENTRPRPEIRSREIADADFVPREEAPSVPRTGGGAQRQAPWDLSAGHVISLCVLVLVLCALLARSGVLGLRESAPPAPLPAEIRLAGTDAALPGPPPSGEAAGREAGLGLVARTVSVPAAEYYTVRGESVLVPGAQVYAVASGGAAEAAGLLPGDVITGWDGRQIASAEELRAAEASCRSGDRVVLTVDRAGETLSVEAELTARTAAGGDGFYRSLETSD